MDPDDDAGADNHPERGDPGDDAAITNELFRYAELIDAGRFAELGELMEHCTFRYGEQGAPGPSGAAAIAEGFRSTVITYADDTPRTRHVTTNPIVEIDRGVARVRSVYTVHQQAPDSPMQTIISGRYEDTLTRIDGRWRFTERCFLVDLVGDLSRHLVFDLPSDIRNPTSKENPT